MTQTGKGYLQWAGTCYGVDLQDDGARVVSAARSRSGVRCTEVRDARLSRLGDGAVCVGGLSARESLVRWLEAPYSAIDKAERVLPTLLDIQLPFPLEDCVFSFLDVIRTPEGTTRALAVAARKSDVERKLRLFGDHGVDPVVLDQEGVALWSQSIEERPPGGNSSAGRVLIHLSGARSVLVVGRGTGILGVHALRAGDTGQVIRMLHAQLGVRDGPTPGEVEWFWSGPGAEDGVAVSEMQERLQKEWPGRSYVHEAPEYFLARALATRALRTGPLRCNLRGGEFTHESMARRARGRARAAAAVVLASGLLLCAASPSARLISGRKIDAANTVFKTTAESLISGPLGPAKGEDALRIVRSELAGETDSLEPFVAAFEPSLSDLLLAVMETGKDNDLRYEVVSLGRDRIEVRGTSSDWNSFSELLSVLGVSEKHLRRKDAGADERIPFSIVADRGR